MAAFAQTPPTVSPELCHTTFHDADDGLVECWRWEPGAQAWRFVSRKTEAERQAAYDARVAFPTRADLDAARGHAAH
jgi:hypothetical protein